MATMMTKTFNGFRLAFNTNGMLASVPADAPLALAWDLYLAGELAIAQGGPATYGHTSYYLPGSSGAERVGAKMHPTAG